MARMRRAAFLCRYAHQSYAEVQRMTDLEQTLLAHCIVDLLNAERTPAEDEKDSDRKLEQAQALAQESFDPFHQSEQNTR